MNRTSPSISRFTLVFLFASITLGCGAGSGDPPRQTILILLDAAVPERFSSYGHPRPTTPEIDALAERGVVFERHFAQSTNTRGSLPTLFFSRYFSVAIFPLSDRVPLEDPRDLLLEPDEHSISLPAAFSKAGIPSVAISAHLWLKRGTRIAEEFDVLHDLSTELSYDRRYVYPRAEEVIDYTLAWLENRLDDDFFLYLHLMDTHFPHYFEEDAQAFFGGDRPPRQNFRPDGTPKNLNRPLPPEDRAYLDALYDGSLRYTDRHLGRLFEFLRRADRLDEMTIAITSDHGEHLLETPPRFSHSGPWYDRLARIPLILFQPARFEPGRYGGLSEGVDVMPTLLEAQGISPRAWDKRTDGVDLLDLLEGEKPPKDHVFMKNAVRSERWKLLLDTAAGDLLGGETLPPLEEISGELYDLENDPEERRDLFADRPEVAAELAAVYRENLRGPYRRFRGSRAQSPPPGPFAIATSHFEIEPGVHQIVLDEANLSHGEVLKRVDEEGWIQVRHWQWYRLYAAGGAESVAVEFPLPSGEYGLLAEICGRFTLELPDAGSVVLDARERPCSGPQIGLVPAGRIDVRDDRFRAVLTPDGQSGTRNGVYRFGFRPLDTGEPEQETEAERERRERLEALGYISGGS